MKKLVVVLGLLVVVTLLAASSGATPAQAAGNTWLVKGTYSDTTCVAVTRHCHTIGLAVTNADPGDTVIVMAGTYNESQISITKSLRVLGAGYASTIIDGGGGSGLANTGTVKITATTGPVVFSGFTLQHPAAQPITKAGSPKNLRVGIYAQSSSAGPTFTISSNKILGTNNPGEDEDYGFYSPGGRENLVFTNNQVTQTGANAILLERHIGATDVSHNSLDAGAYGTDAYFNMSYGGDTITSLQRVSYNTIDLGPGTYGAPGHTNASGVSFASSFGDGGVGGFPNVEIFGNTITNVNSQRRGIGLWNGSSNGTDGNIVNAKITGNTITGVGSIAGSKAIQLLGLVTNATIQSNNVSGVDYAFHGRLNTVGSSAYPVGTIISNNAFSGSTRFVWDGSATLNAPSNWWGCVAGPTNPGCILVVGNVNYTPWAKAVTSSTTASTHEIGETGTLQTNVTAPGIYGAQLRVTHDTGILTFNQPASSHNNAGGFFWDVPAENFVTVTSPSGIRLSGSMQAPTHPTGVNLTNANIATWKYNCATVGTSALTYDTTAGLLGTKLSDINGLEIPSALLGDSITCLATTASVDGYIGLQGRLKGAMDPTGWVTATVMLTCNGGACLGSGPGMYTLTTDKNGYYSLVGSGAGTGITLGTYSAMVTRRGYLGATKATDVTIAAGSNTINLAADPQVPTLLGGDANDDGTIDSLDLTTIGLAFGAAPAGGADTGADINGDNVVNIFDLVLAGGNFGLNTSSWTP